MLSTSTTNTSDNDDTSSLDDFLIRSVEEETPKAFGNISYKSDDNVNNSSEIAKASGKDITILEEKEYKDRSGGEVLSRRKKKKKLLKAEEQIFSLQKELVDAASQHGEDVTELSQQLEDLNLKLSDANDKISDLRKQSDAKSSYSSTEGQEKTNKAIKNEVRKLKQIIKDKDNVHEKELAELRERSSDSGEKEEAVIMKDGLDNAIQTIALLQKQFEDKQLSKESNGNSSPQKLEKMKKMWGLKESEYKSKQVELEGALLAAKTRREEDNTMIAAASENFQAELKKRDEMLETAQMKFQELLSEEEQLKNQDNTYCELVASKEQVGALEKKLQDIKSQQKEETSGLQRRQEHEIEALHRQLHDVHTAFAQKETQYQNKLDDLMHQRPSYGTKNPQLGIPSMKDNNKQQQSATITTAAAQPLSEQAIANSNQRTLGPPSTSKFPSDQSGDRWSSFGSTPFINKHQRKNQGSEKNSSISSSSLKDYDQQNRTEPSERQINNGGGNLYSNDNSTYQQQQNKDRSSQYDPAPFDERNAPPPQQYFPNQQEGYAPLNSNQKSPDINGPGDRWSRWSSFGNIPFCYDQSKTNSQQEARYTQEEYNNNNIPFQEGANLGNRPESRWSSFDDSPFNYDELSLQQQGNDNDMLQHPEDTSQYMDSPSESFPENLPPSPMDLNVSPDSHWSASGNRGGVDPFSSDPFDE